MRGVAPPWRPLPPLTRCVVRTGRLRRKLLERLDVKHTFCVLLLCEGRPLYPPGTCTDRTDAVFEVDICGKRLRQMARVLHLAGKVLSVLAFIGKVAGLPLPSEVPGLGDAVGSYKVMKALDDVWCAVGNIREDVESAREHVAEAKTAADAAAATVPPELPRGNDKLVGQSYRALIELLENEGLLGTQGFVCGACDTAVWSCDALSRVRLPADLERMPMRDGSVKWMCAGCASYARKRQLVGGTRTVNTTVFS